MLKNITNISDWLSKKGKKLFEKLYCHWIICMLIPCSFRIPEYVGLMITKSNLLFCNFVICDNKHKATIALWGIACTSTAKVANFNERLGSKLVHQIQPFSYKIV